jgi:hypothetical protein
VVDVGLVDVIAIEFAREMGLVAGAAVDLASAGVVPLAREVERSRSVVAIDHQDAPPIVGMLGAAGVELTAAGVPRAEGFGRVEATRVLGVVRVDQGFAGWFVEGFTFGEVGVESGACLAPR